MKRPRSFRTIGGAIAVDFRGAALSAPTAGPELRVDAGGFTAECSRGWAGRCAGAHGPTCRCACGGQNHGKARPVDSRPNGPHDAWGRKRRRGPQLELDTMSRLTPSREFQYAAWERIERTELPRHDGRTLFFIRPSKDPDHVGDTQVLVREANGMAAVQLPQRIVYHSPSGFEWGYGGSGPADLALNILTLLVSPKEANRMHQDFKSEYIATMPREGGELPMETVRQWIADWYRASEEPDAEHNALVAGDDVDDGRYIADRVAERDDTPPAPYE